MKESEVPTDVTTDSVRVFVAATPAEWLPMKVLEFSICESTRLSVQLSAIYTHQRPIPVPRDAVNKARTPFSFQRFLIPELCERNGKAIYMDADMQVFHDIAALWNRPFGEAVLQTVGSAAGARRSQFSVMLMDCSRLGWNVDDIVCQLDKGEINYQELMYDMKLASPISYSIPETWNSLECFIPGETCLLHYTDMNTQPWVSLDNPNEVLWVSCLRRALDAGFITLADLEREIGQGHVRPSLLSQISAVSTETWKPTLSDILRDAQFLPPFYSIAASRWGALRVFRSRLLRAGRLILRPLMRQKARP
ncbi:glycosyltransferase [Pseudomonas alliivorans]|uniref:glycosyltransferase n=1 Tax=Pseudomonas sp. CDFA 610 TaxID=2829825 RepID=UPI0016090ACA|nr:glycosyltransferase [Pseudomonas sp. CDFA 610]MEE4343805.1 glycosyltransferase [Pseudomonas alliivorans]MCD5982653.1 glycosyl transferase [Pseudomonas sp. CDFA 610]MEE4734328.1 glycosyltransferase [Pseudomonas alliivorans]MEE5053967.1 glycosyltransferase [Pseudomonas alliivorans]MEE5071459.1 glycosyltransferase [Pseudomonas alliivorans]